MFLTRFFRVLTPSRFNVDWHCVYVHHAMRVECTSDMIPMNDEVADRDYQLAATSISCNSTAGRLVTAHCQIVRNVTYINPLSRDSGHLQTSIRFLPGPCHDIRRISGSNRWCCHCHVD
jgi:hypothetical protein